MSLSPWMQILTGGARSFSGPTVPLSPRREAETWIADRPRLDDFAATLAAAGDATDEVSRAVESPEDDVALAPRPRDRADVGREPRDRREVAEEARAEADAAGTKEQARDRADVEEQRDRAQTRAADAMRAQSAPAPESRPEPPTVGSSADVANPEGDAAESAQTIYATASGSRPSGSAGSVPGSDPRPASSTRLESDASGPSHEGRGVPAAPGTSGGRASSTTHRAEDPGRLANATAPGTNLSAGIATPATGVTTMVAALPGSAAQRLPASGRRAETTPVAVAPLPVTPGSSDAPAAERGPSGSMGGPDRSISSLLRGLPIGFPGGGSGELAIDVPATATGPGPASGTNGASNDAWRVTSPAGSARGPQVAMPTLAAAAAGDATTTAAAEQAGISTGGAFSVGAEVTSAVRPGAPGGETTIAAPTNDPLVKADLAMAAPASAGGEMPVDRGPSLASTIPGSTSGPQGGLRVDDGAGVRGLDSAPRPATVVPGAERLGAFQRADGASAAAGTKSTFEHGASSKAAEAGPRTESTATANAAGQTGPAVGDDGLLPTGRAQVPVSAPDGSAPSPSPSVSPSHGASTATPGESALSRAGADRPGTGEGVRGASTRGGSSDLLTGAATVGTAGMADAPPRGDPASGGLPDGSMAPASGLSLESSRSVAPAWQVDRGATPQGASGSTSLSKAVADATNDATHGATHSSASSRAASEAMEAATTAAVSSPSNAAMTSAPIAAGSTEPFSAAVDASHAAAAGGAMPLEESSQPIRSSGEPVVLAPATRSSSGSPAAASRATPRVLDPGAPVTPRDLPTAVPHTLKLAVREGVREARIRLWPPELGAVRVDLRVNGHQVTARFEAERADVRTMLESMRSELSRGLQEAGLKLQSLDIAAAGDGALRSSGGPEARAAGGSSSLTGGSSDGSGSPDRNGSNPLGGDDAWSAGARQGGRQGEHGGGASPRIDPASRVAPEREAVDRGRSGPVGPDQRDAVDAWA